MKSVLSVPSFLIAIFAWGALSCSSTKDDIRVCTQTLSSQVLLQFLLT